MSASVLSALLEVERWAQDVKAGLQTWGAGPLDARNAMTALENLCLAAGHGVRVSSVIPDVAQLRRREESDAALIARLAREAAQAWTALDELGAATCEPGVVLDLKGRVRWLAAARPARIAEENASLRTRALELRQKNTGLAHAVEDMAARVELAEAQVEHLRKRLEPKPLGTPPTGWLEFGDGTAIFSGEGPEAEGAAALFITRITAAFGQMPRRTMTGEEATRTVLASRRAEASGDRLEVVADMLDCAMAEVPEKVKALLEAARRPCQHHGDVVAEVEAVLEGAIGPGIRERPLAEWVQVLVNARDEARELAHGLQQRLDDRVDRHGFKAVLHEAQQRLDPSTPGLQACVPQVDVLAPEPPALDSFVRCAMEVLGMPPIASSPHLARIAEAIERGGRLVFTPSPMSHRRHRAEVMKDLRRRLGVDRPALLPAAAPPSPVRQALDGAYLVLDETEGEERARWAQVLDGLEAAVSPRTALRGLEADFIVADDGLAVGATPSGFSYVMATGDGHVVPVPAGVERPEQPAGLVRLPENRVRVLAEKMGEPVTTDEARALAAELLALRAARQVLTWVGAPPPTEGMLGVLDAELHAVAGPGPSRPLAPFWPCWVATEVLESRPLQRQLEEQLALVPQTQVSATARILLEVLRVGLTGRHLLHPGPLPAWEKLEGRLVGALHMMAAAIHLRWAPVPGPAVTTEGAAHAS